MAIDITVPSVGESITQGTIARWLKQNGQTVQSGDPLFELETDKATTEVAAQASGRLAIRVPEGKTVAIGSVVGAIEPVASGSMAKVGEEKSNGPQRGQVAPAEVPRPSGPREQAPPLSPSVRRLVAETGVNVVGLQGTGRGGRVTREDVLARAQEKQPPTATVESPSAAKSDSRPPSEARETRQPMSAIRLRIAERLVAAQRQAAILTTFNEADMSAILRLRGKYKEAFHKKHGVGLGFMPFFVKAAVEALKAHPLVNARIDGTDILQPNFYDIGVAVSTEKGLLVPVVRDADRLSFAEVEKTIAALAEKARTGKISVSDLQGGTFTITNGGVFGSLLSTPLLNPPQSGILGMHTIQKRPIAVGDQVVVRPMMYLALSYDHRLVDGRDAVGFLIRIKECIEDPERLLLEI